MFEVLEGFLLVGFEVGDEIGVFPEGRGAECGDLHEGCDEAFLVGFWGGLWVLW